jgi:hypothetical protein
MCRIYFSEFNDPEQTDENSLRDVEDSSSNTL